MAVLVSALQDAERLSQRLPYYFIDGETGEDLGGSETTVIREEEAA